MYIELINGLSAEDRKALAERGIPPSRVSEWKTGFRLPTRPQALALADLKGINPITLESELVMIETEREAEQKPAMQKILDRMRETYKTLMM